MPIERIPEIENIVKEWSERLKKQTELLDKLQETIEALAAEGINIEVTLKEKP